MEELAEMSWLLIFIHGDPVSPCGGCVPRVRRSPCAPSPLSDANLCRSRWATGWSGHSVGIAGVARLNDAENQCFREALPM